MLYVTSRLFSAYDGCHYRRRSIEPHPCSPRPINYIRRVMHYLMILIIETIDVQRKQDMHYRRLLMSRRMGEGGGERDLLLPSRCCYSLHFKRNADSFLITSPVPLRRSVNPQYNCILRPLSIRNESPEVYTRVLSPLSKTLLRGCAVLKATRRLPACE